MRFGQCGGPPVDQLQRGDPVDFPKRSRGSDERLEIGKPTDCRHPMRRPRV